MNKGKVKRLYIKDKKDINKVVEKIGINEEGKDNLIHVINTEIEEQQ